MSAQTPVPESALHPHPLRPPTYHARLPLSGLPSGQTLVRELPQTPTPEQPAALHSAPAVVSAPVQLPVQLFARLHVGATDTQTPRRQTSIANIDTRLSGC